MRTNARGRRTTAREVTVATETSVGTHDVVPDEGRAEARRAWARSGAAAAGSVPDREVAGSPLRHGAENGPRDVGLPRLRRGRGAAHPDMGTVQGAPEPRGDRGHPL